LLVTIGLVVAFVGASLYASHIASDIDVMAADVAGNVNPSIRYLGAARTELHELDDLLTSSGLDGTDPALLRQEVDIHWQLMRQSLDAYAALPFLPAEHPRWQVVDLDLSELQAQTSALLSKMTAGDAKGAKALRTGAIPQAVARSDRALKDLMEFDAEQGTLLARNIADARRRSQQMALGLDALAVLLAGVLVVTAITATRQHMTAIREAHDVDRRLVRRLRAAAASAVAITESLGRSGDLRDALHVAVERARDLAAADLAALGIGQDPSRLFEPFVFAGVEPGLMDLLGAAQPRGILGVLIADQRTVQIGDVWGHPRLVGMPERHPRVGPFLGVAVRDSTGVVGYLYLGRKPGAPPFSDEDAGAVELLAEFVASTMQTASLYSSLRKEVTAREDLLSMVSHDLRNPLSAVSMAAANARRSLESDAPLRRQLDLITRNSDRMDRMIGDLLTAAKLHEGKLSVEPRAQDAASLVREAIEAFAAAAAEKDVHIGSEIADDVPPVYCDGTRIGQVLSNLLANALHFTPDGGSIVVSVHRCRACDREVCFSVRDTGIGIPDDAIPHLFERFWQKKEHAAGGTGLGLFICRGLVEAHHGRIWVTSRLGEGSDFQFVLPAVDDRIGRGTTQPEAAPSAGAANAVTTH
jgi:signal transduction histidine kinase